MISRVAVASSDGEWIDLHFGQAYQFYIYDIDDSGYSLTEVRKVGALLEHNAEKIEKKAAVLQDCDALFAAKIGLGAVRQLAEQRIRTFEAPFAVEAVLKKVVSKKIIAVDQVKEDKNMTVLDKEIVEAVNQLGRIGILATADAKGQPNEAYFGTAGILPDGSFSVALGDSRTLKNLQENPKAAYLVLGEAPVTFATKGWRLYLRVRAIQKDGELLTSIREKVAEKAGAAVAAQLQAAVLLDVTEVRPLIAQA